MKQDVLQQTETPKPKKRRWWLIILAVIIVLAAIASQSDETSDVDAKQTASTQTKAEDLADTPATTEAVIAETEPETPKIGVPAVHKDETVTVLRVEYDSGSEFTKPDKDMQFVHVQVEIQNGGTKNLSVNPLKFEIKTTNGEIMKEDFSASVALKQLDEKSLNVMDLASGGKTTGYISFQVPVEDENLTLLYLNNAFSSRPLLEIALTD